MLQQEQNYDQDYQNIPEDEIETRYLYIYDEDPEQRRWRKFDRGQIVNLCMQALALVMLTGFCLVPGQPNYQVQTVRVSALFLPVVGLEASAKIVATGVKTISARHASGTLTVYNGSILQEWLPTGFMVTTQNGIEITTDQAAVIPAADPPAFGVATVPAQALLAGGQGNIPTGAIHQADGSSLVIKNLVPFTGGRDAGTMRFVQERDREAAIAAARARVEAEKPTSGLLAWPCAETVQQAEIQVTVKLDCQYVTYQVPAGARVLSAHVEGRTVVILLQTIVLPAQEWTAACN